MLVVVIKYFLLFLGPQVYYFDEFQQKYFPIPTMVCQKRTWNEVPAGAQYFR